MTLWFWNFQYWFSIRNSIILTQHEMRTKSSLCCKYRFTSLKIRFNSKHVVCTDQSHDRNWSDLKKEKDINRWRYHWYLYYISVSLKCGCSRVSISARCVSRVELGYNKTVYLWIAICIYIYIVIQTVSFYHNSSVWTLEAGIETRPTFR